MRNLLRLLAARHAAFLAASAVLLGLFQYLICAAVASVDVGGALQVVMQSVPPLLRGLVETQLFGGLTPRGLLAFGWNHPVAHALGTAPAIVLAARAIAGEAERGTIELELAQPLRRSIYLAAHVGFAAWALTMVTVAGIAGTLIGQRVFGLPGFRPGVVAALGIDYLLLQFAWFAVTLLFSAWGREGGRVAAIGFLVALVSYFAQVIGQLWEHAAFVLPYTLHDYFSPRDLLVDGTSVLQPALVLLAVSVVGVGTAAWRFATRDLP
jgi:ABC-type transport system involved in multi-copper enzyme maturation permease subunit